MSSNPVPGVLFARESMAAAEHLGQEGLVFICSSRAMSDAIVWLCNATVWQDKNFEGCCETATCFRQHAGNGSMLQGTLFAEPQPHRL